MRPYFSAWITSFALVACGETRAPSTLPYTDPYAELDYLSQLEIGAGSMNLADRLRDAALLHINGLSRENAVAWLENDGFVCDAGTCVTSAYDRETVFERMLVPAIRPFPSREPYHWRTDYRIEIVGDRVDGPSSLVADVTATRAE